MKTMYAFSILFTAGIIMQFFSCSAITYLPEYPDKFRIVLTNDRWIWTILSESQPVIPGHLVLWAANFPKTEWLFPGPNCRIGRCLKMFSQITLLNFCYHLISKSSSWSIICPVNKIGRIIISQKVSNQQCHLKNTYFFFSKGLFWID